MNGNYCYTKKTQCKMSILISVEIHDSISKHILKGLNSVIFLTIHLGMKTDALFNLSTKPFLERPPKPRCVLCTPIQ